MILQRTVAKIQALDGYEKLIQESDACIRQYEYEYENIHRDVTAVNEQQTLIKVCND